MTERNPSQHFMGKVIAMTGKSLGRAGIIVKILLVGIAALVLAGPPTAATGQEGPPPEPADAPEPGGAETTPEADMEEWIELNLPDPMDIKLFVDFVGQKLGIKFIYDEELTGNITLKPNQRIRVGELYDLLHTTLKFKGFSMIRAGDWTSILPTEKASMYGRVLQPGEMPAPKAGETIVSQLVPLRYADPADVQSALLPYLSEKGQIIPMPEQGMISLIEYKSRVEELRPLIKLVDVQPSEIETRIIELRHTKAPDVAYRLSNWLNAKMQGKKQKTIPVRTTSGGTTRINYTKVTVEPETPPFIDVDERTNRLILIGEGDDLDELEELIAILDVERKDFQEIRFYDLTYLSAEDALASLMDLGLAGAEGIGTGAARARQQRAGGAAAEEVGGRGAAPRVSILRATNTLIVSATAEEHRRIEIFLTEADKKREEQANVRIYTLERRNPEDVAGWLKSVFQADSIDPKTKTPIPGIEGAPEIVPVQDTNSIIVSATPAQHSQIESLLIELDATQPQVLLECTLVEVTNRDDEDIGLELETWTSGGTPGDGESRGTYLSSEFALSARDETTGLKVFASAPGAGATIAFLNDEFVNVLLRAVQRKSNARVLSKPRILVNDNEKGTIISQDEEPVVSIDALNTATTTRSFNRYVEAGTTLEITPHISDGDFLKLEIAAKVSTFTGTSEAQDVPPPRSTRDLQTVITVPDQRSIVIGGLTGKRQIKSLRQVPLIADIPLFGELFKYREKEDTKVSIYLFVKASILRDVNFRDLHEETGDVFEDIPEDLQALDETLSEEGARKEIEKWKEIRRRRAEEAEKAEQERAEKEGESREVPVEPQGPSIRIPGTGPVIDEPYVPQRPGGGGQQGTEPE